MHEAATDLQKRADTSGQPQGYLFNGTPLFAMPGGSAKSMVDAWRKYDD